MGRVCRIFEVVRAETAVKSVKKIVAENCSVSGELNMDSFSLA